MVGGRPWVRRLTTLAVATVLVAVGAATPARSAGAAVGSGWPRADGGVYGIDVSSVQGEVDWRAVAAQHVSFAYIKATQGETYLDPYFADDWAGAKAAGLAYGAYEYFSFCSSGLAQAQAFLNTVPDDPTALPPVLDLELKGNCSTRPSTAVVAGQVKAFVDTVQAATGKTVISYVGWDFAGRYRDLALLRTHPHWSRRVKRPSARAAVIWQVYSPVPVDGVAGDVDLDITRLASLRALRA